MKIVISGNVPSKKNNKQIAKAGDRYFIRSNDRVKVWTEMAIIELIGQFQGFKISGYPIRLTLVFYFDNKRRHDLDNAAATVLDAMVESGILEDDSVEFVNRIALQYGGIDKENPRTEIILDD